MHFISDGSVGIVKISEDMHENLRVASNALSRSINAQAEHWMRIGMLTELHPNLDHSEICRVLIRAELAGGLDLKQLCALADDSHRTEVDAVSGVQ
jgi:glycine cleavage system pyridoxal-binding protein P